MHKLFILILTLGLISCDTKSILGDEPAATDPAAVFDALWSDMDRHYALFDVKCIDWDSVYQVNRKNIFNTMSNYQLRSVCFDMLESLSDRHITIWDQVKSSFWYMSGGKEALESAYEISLYLIQDTLETGWRELNEHMFCGKIKNHDVGYLYIGSMHDYPIDDIDKAIKSLWPAKAIILDVRQNNGGSLEYAQRVAGFFADNENLMLKEQFRNGPSHSDFGKATEIYTKKYGEQQYHKPVVVLTDCATVSAAEWMLMSMKSFKHVVQIGDSTSGNFSVIGPVRFLPNGWCFRYSIEKVVTADDKCLESIGHTPDIYVRNSAEEMQKTNRDEVLITALEYLKKEHGI